MKVFFISDLHLNAQAPASYQLFIKFCDTLPKDTLAVYILGDLFEFWIDDNWSSTFITNIKNTLTQLSHKCKIYFIAGNRDFLLGNKFALATNITILPNIFVLKLFQYRLLLTHGDLLCKADRSHVYFTKFIRHKITIFIVRLLPIKLKLILAKFLRNLSNYKHLIHAKHHKTKYDICMDTAQQLMQQHATSILIHGHTHEPKIHKYNQNFIRIVLSDWHQHATILEFNPNGYQLININI